MREDRIATSKWEKEKAVGKNRESFPLWKSGSVLKTNTDILRINKIGTY
jgi:hypothetical protein